LVFWALETTRSMFIEIDYRTRTHSITSNLSDALIYFLAIFAACLYCRHLGLVSEFPLQLRGRLCYTFYPSARQSNSPPRTPAISSSSSFRETTPSRGKIAEGKVASPYFDSYGDNMRPRSFVCFLEGLKKALKGTATWKRDSVPSMRPDLPQRMLRCDLRDTACHWNEVRNIRAKSAIPIAAIPTRTPYAGRNRKLDRDRKAIPVDVSVSLAFPNPVSRVLDHGYTGDIFAEWSSTKGSSSHFARGYCSTPR
ncbi:hypothetical protein V8E53_011643, partial [Lactarius tabidus]